MLIKKTIVFQISCADFQESALTNIYFKVKKERL